LSDVVSIPWNDQGIAVAGALVVVDLPCACFAHDFMAHGPIRRHAAAARCGR
jgi:hypothetical protein